jgi:ferric-dicitrate binding protein FerR (iron transport regulator)
VEGKVKVQALSGSSEAKVLRPNEQSVYQEQHNTFTITPVDPLYATAWRNGNFSFNRASIREVMGSIARWYDVDVEYKGRFTQSVFSGTISKFEQIDKLLATIALTGDIHFKREGRRILVME